MTGIIPVGPLKTRLFGLRNQQLESQIGRNIVFKNRLVINYGMYIVDLSYVVMCSAISFVIFLHIPL